MTDLSSIKITINVIRPNDNKPMGYIGATFSALAPLPGEDWLRGGDLADGPHSEETMRRIWRDITNMVEIGNKLDV